MKVGRAILPTLGSLFLGPGFGLAAIGRRRRAALWFGAVYVTLASVALWFWMFPVAFVVILAAVVDTFVIAARTDDLRTRWIQPATIAVAVGAVVGFLVIRTVAVEAFRIPASSMSPTLEVGDHLFIDKLTPHFRAIGRGEMIVFEWPCDRTRDYVKRVVAVAGDTVEIRCDVIYINGQAIPQQLVDADATYLDSDVPDGAWVTRHAMRYAESIDGHDHLIQYRPTHVANKPGFADFPRRGSPAPTCDRSPEVGSDSEGCAPQEAYTVPPDTVFTLGDSRDNSNDSRFWGPVPVANIKGRVTGIWMTDRPGAGKLSRFGTVE